MSAVTIKSVLFKSIAALSLVAAGAAQADLVQIQSAFPDSNPLPSDHSQIQMGMYASFDTDPLNAVQHTIVPFTATISGNSNPLLNGSFLAFCFEPTQALDPVAHGTGDASYATSFISPSRPLVQRLFDYGFATAGASASSAIAFNLALQELLFEGSGTYSLGTGSFTREIYDGTYTNSVTALASANALLAQVVNGPDAAVHMRVFSTVSPSSQDLMSAIGADNNTVPEPSSALLGLGALAALAAFTRRRGA